MKLFLLVLFATIAVGATGISEMNYHGIDYKKMVQEINSANGLWKARVPNDVEYYKNTLGALRSDKRLGYKYIHSRSNVKLPKSFNPVDKWPKCESLRDIRDQSVCGSCWAFGAAEAASDRLCIHSNGTHQERISATDILSCCDYCGFGCKGGFPILAWSYLHNIGAVTGYSYGDKNYCYPYPFPECDHHVNFTKSEPCGAVQPTPECKPTCQDGYPVSYKQDKHFFDVGYAIPNDTEAIMRELYENGPVEVTFFVYEDFIAYDHGIYNHITGKGLGAHAVKLLGWGEEAGVKYWTIANSWNAGWGEKGYFRILRGTNECGIEEQAVAGMPIV